MEDEVRRENTAMPMHLRPPAYGALVCFAITTWACGRPEASPGRATVRPSRVVTATVASPADSHFVKVRTRLAALGYRVDEADSVQRRMIVRAPGDSGKVEVRIANEGNQPGLTIPPLAEGLAALRALITVTHDASIETAAAAVPTDGDSGGLLRSGRRPEFFVAPAGRFW